MSHTNESVFTNIMTAVAEVKMKPINRHEAECLHSLVGTERLRILFPGVRSGNAENREELSQAIAAVRASTFLADHNINEFTTVDLLVMIQAKGVEYARDLLGQLQNGEANAFAIMRQLANKQAGPMPVEDLGAPLHATDVPPPGNQRAAPVRPAAQAYRSDGNAPRAPSATVSQLPVRNAPAQSEDAPDFDEPTDDRYAPPAQPNHQVANNEKKYDQRSCFGKDTAIQFERTPNMRRTTNTVNIKIAREKTKGRTCKEGVDWQNGIVIMLEPYEIQLIYAVMMGMGPKFRAAGHGSDNMKWIEVEETTGEWAGAVRFTIGIGKTDIRRVNVSYTDIKKVLELFSRTLQDQGDGQSSVWMLAEIRRVYDLYNKKTVATASRNGGQHQRREANG